MIETMEAPANSNRVREARAVVICTSTGLFGTQLIEGLDAGRWWALEGRHRVGQMIRVAYYPADQFANIKEWLE